MKPENSFKDTIDLNNICRTCLRPSVAFKSVFESAANRTHVDNVNISSFFDELENRSINEIDDISLHQAILSCTQVQITKDDGMPMQICLDCAEEVSRAFAYHRMCVKSDETLRRYLKHKQTFTVIKEEQEQQLQQHPPIINLKSNQCELTNDIFPPSQSAKHCDEDLNSLIDNDKLNNIPDLNFIKHEEHIIKEHFEYRISQTEVVVPVGISPAIVPKKPFSCEICFKQFVRSEHFKRHRMVHRKDAKRFICDICKRKFNRKDNLKSHMLVHRQAKDKEDVDRHLCVYCGNSFSNSSNLIVHMRRHTGEKPYKCDFCDKGFPRSSDLQCHRRTHTGEKPCLCTICGKGFSRSNKLVRHMRIHTGVRPYKCTYCERAFTQSNDLTLHIRRHTGDKPYMCGICGDRFIQNTALQTHRRQTGHQDDEKALLAKHTDNAYSTITVSHPRRLNEVANSVHRIGEHMDASVKPPPQQQQQQPPNMIAMHTLQINNISKMDFDRNFTVSEFS